MSSYFHSASQSCPILPANCRYSLHLFRLFRGYISVWINRHRQNDFYTVMLWKGSQVPQEEDEETVTKKAIKELEIFFSQIFYNFFQFISFFFNYFTLSLISYTFSPTTFTHTHTHDPHPRPTTSTHDPRPTTFSYTPLRGVKRRTALCLLSAFRPRLFAPLFIWVCAFDRELVNH